MRGQQVRFNAFRIKYDDERPYEAIGQRPPGTLYAPSRRGYDKNAWEEDPYPGHRERRRVRTDGTITWKGELLYISQPLIGRLAGLAETDEDRWALHFQRKQIGLIEGRGDGTRVRDVLPERPTMQAPEDAR